MCERTTPAEPWSGPKRRPSRVTPSEASNVISREPAVEPCGASLAHETRRESISARAGMVLRRFGEAKPRPRRYLPSFRRWCRVRLSSFLCFFLRIFFLRFFTSDGNEPRLSFGSEEVPEVDPLRTEALLQTNGTQSKCFGRLCHRRDQPEPSVAGDGLEVPDTREASFTVRQTYQKSKPIR